MKVNEFLDIIERNYKHYTKPRRWSTFPDWSLVI